MNTYRTPLSLVPPPSTPGDVHAEPTEGDVIREAFQLLEGFTVVAFAADLEARDLPHSEGHVTNLVTGKREPTVDEWKAFQDFVTVPELVRVCGSLDRRLTAGAGVDMMVELTEALTALGALQAEAVRALANGSVNRREYARIAAKAHTVIDEVKDVVSAAGVGA